MIKEALAGDIVFVATPAVTTRAATAAAFNRKVAIELRNAKGERHTWFNGDISVSIADTSALGTASIHGGDTTPTMSQGRCVVQVDGDAAAWLAGETNTLTVAQATILGQTVAAKTSAETITA